MADVEVRVAEVTFRRATNRDEQLALHIVDSALREYGLWVLPESSDVDLTDIEEHYDAHGGRLEVLESATGEALGVLGWRDAGDGVFELKKLYLTRGARGRGIGRASLDRAVEHARAAGARAIVLETSQILAEANRLYRRYGFIPVSGAEAASFAVLSDQCDLAYRLELVTAS